MATVNSKVRSGNTVKIYFDGVSVGLIKSLSTQDSYGLEAITGIGDIHVQEHVATVATHTLSVQTMVLKKGTLRQLGFSLTNGDEALTGKVFDIISFDSNGEMLRKYTGCSFDSGSVEITANHVISASCQFKALDVTGSAM